MIRRPIRLSLTCAAWLAVALAPSAHGGGSGSFNRFDGSNEVRDLRPYVDNLDTILHVSVGRLAAVVRAPAACRASADELRSLLERGFARFEELVPLHPPTTVEIVLLPVDNWNRGNFLEHQADVGAVAPLIGSCADRAWSRGPAWVSLSKAPFHEMFHRASKVGRRPIWLEEGAAEYVAEKVHVAMTGADAVSTDLELERFVAMDPAAAKRLFAVRKHPFTSGRGANRFRRFSTTYWRRYRVALGAYLAADQLEKNLLAEYLAGGSPNIPELHRRSQRLRPALVEKAAFATDHARFLNSLSILGHCPDHPDAEVPSCAWFGPELAPFIGGCVSTETLMERMGSCDPTEDPAWTDLVAGWLDRESLASLQAAILDPSNREAVAQLPRWVGRPLKLTDRDKADRKRVRAWIRALRGELY